MNLYKINFTLIMHKSYKSEIFAILILLNQLIMLEKLCIKPCGHKNW